MKNPYFLLAWLLDVAGLGLAITFLFDPWPWVRILCAIMPWFALGVMYLSGGRLVVSGNRNVWQPDIFLAIYLPLIAFAFWAALEVRVLDWPVAVAAGIGVGVLLALAFVAARSGKPQAGLAFAAVMLAVVGSGYSYGVVTLADTTGDTRIVQTYRPQVLGKYVRKSRNITDYLVLDAWGPQPRRDISVDDVLYETAVVGQAVCVEVHPGRLGVRWYTMRSCAVTGEGKA